MSQPLLLLLDDSREMGLIVANLGRRAGWDVTACPDVEAAWQALQVCRPDLVLLDVNLPGPSGLDWLRQVRQTPEFADMAVALYTNWGLPRDVAAGLEAGVDFVFDKNLATRPADWQRRLQEIGQFRRSEQADVGWSKGSRGGIMYSGDVVIPPPQVWAAAFRQAFRHPLLRRMTQEVTPVVMLRALTRAFAPRILPQELDAWVAPDGPDPARLPPTFAPASLVDLAVRLAEQIGQLLGNDARAAFRDALAAALPGAQEILSLL
jgi:CheY-like chemotaxis protein